LQQYSKVLSLKDPFKKDMTKIKHPPRQYTSPKSNIFHVSTPHQNQTTSKPVHLTKIKQPPSQYISPKGRNKPQNFRGVTCTDWKCRCKASYQTIVTMSPHPSSHIMNTISVKSIIMDILVRLLSLLHL
jgi:hypothetical protein